MKQLLIAVLVAAFGSAAIGSDVSAGIGVMAKDSTGFGWQANVPDDGVIEWRWENASKAAVTVVSALTGETVLSTEVSKSGTEKYGSFTLPEASETQDQLFDLTVALTGGETLTARVARPAAKATVQSEKDSRKWRGVRLSEPRLFAYDCAWFGAEDASAASCKVDAAVTALPAVCGFGVVDGHQVATAGAFPFELAFDQLTCFSTMLRLVGGMSIIVR